MTWIEIGHAVGEALRHSPIEAEPADFDRAADHFADIEGALNDVAGELRRLQGRGDDFKGQTAEAFVAKLAVLSDDLEKVPRIAFQVKDIMRHHGYWLRELQAEAERALAAARSRKTELEAARNRESQAGSRLALIERQIRSLEALEAAGDDSVSYTLAQARVDEGRTRSEERRASGDVSHWTTQVRSSVEQYRDIDLREANLNKETAQKVYGIHFQGLHDPNAFERYVGRPVGEFLDDIRDFAVAVISGDWQTALWKLDDILATIGSVLFFVALFVPGLQLVAFAFAAAKLVTSLALFVGKGYNPETGEQKSAGSLAWDAASVVLSGAAVGTARASLAARSQLVIGTDRTGKVFATQGVRIGTHIVRRATVDGADRAVRAVNRVFDVKSLLDASDHLHGQSAGDLHRAPTRFDLPAPTSTAGPTKALICAAA